MNTEETKLKAQQERLNATVANDDLVEIEYIGESFDIEGTVFFEKGMRSMIPKEVWEKIKHVVTDFRIYDKQVETSNKEVKIKKFKKKPIVVEAIQLTKDTLQECYDFVEAKGNFSECGMGIDPADGKFKITTLEGIHTVNINDWIIKGIAGEFYPCKPSIFETTYDPIN